eukprot:COSAG02_NODE_554_length_20414_cov_67.356535_21_plen_40_part_00
MSECLVRNRIVPQAGSEFSPQVTFVTSLEPHEVRRAHGI